MTLKEQLAIIKKHQESLPVHVVPIATDLDVDVYRASNWPDILSGMIKRRAVGSCKYDIYVNANHHEHRRRFTIAHELAHLILHKPSIGDGITDDALYRSGLSSRMEAQANRMAANILMPWELLEPWLERETIDIAELASVFNVSQSAMSIRLGVPYED